MSALARCSLLVVATMLVGACQTSAGVPVQARSFERTKGHATLRAKLGACKTQSDCTITWDLRALADTHVNAEYPHRFTPAANDAVTFAEASTVEFDGEKSASWMQPLKLKEASAPISGTVAVSICNEASCYIEKIDVDMVAPGESGAPRSH